MAYATSNPPMAINGFRRGKGTLWLYYSADDDVTVNAANYFTNGDDLGMSAGDPVIVIDTTTPKASFHYVTEVSSDGATTAFGAVA